MLHRLLIGLLYALPAYAVGAVGGGYLLYLASTNLHDRSLEAEMTGAFVLGPLAAVIGFLVGTVRGRSGRRSDASIAAAER
jgi:hypothetical protein